MVEWHLFRLVLRGRVQEAFLSKACYGCKGQPCRSQGVPEAGQQHSGGVGQGVAGCQPVATGQKKITGQSQQSWQAVDQGQVQQISASAGQWRLDS